MEEYRESYDSEAEVAACGDDLIADGVRELIGELDASGVLIGLVTSASCWRTDRSLFCTPPAAGKVTPSYQKGGNAPSPE